MSLPTFLPGTFTLERGSRRDYLALEHFHYLPKRPSSWALVLRVVYDDGSRSGPRVIAVGVLSYPVLRCRTRERVLGLNDLNERGKISFANRYIRSISRVIVHPQFRALGLASALVRALIENCPSRYVEAMAVMGKAHPFFKSGGMTEYGADAARGPNYYLVDRAKCPTGSPASAGTFNSDVNRAHCRMDQSPAEARGPDHARLVP